MDYTNLRTTQKVTILQKDLTSTKKSLSDLNFEKFGTNKKSLILAKIGGGTQGFQKRYTDYLNSL